MDDPQDLPTGIWKLDPAATTVTASVKKLGMITVNATLRVSDSTIMIATSDEGELGGSVTVDVDATSYTSKNTKRNQHVTSPDFFDAEQYPLIKFVGTSMEPVADGYRVTGDLTVKDRTRSVTFDATAIRAEGNRGSFRASAVVDRGELGVDRMPSFFLGDPVAITVDAKLDRQG